LGSSIFSILALHSTFHTRSSGIEEIDAELNGFLEKRPALLFMKNAFLRAFSGVP
jgi:hypothetical protein